MAKLIVLGQEARGGRDVLAPAKVTRYARRDVTSIAVPSLTSDALVVDKP